jgi:glycosyltransferase involved in cell wall biosynthesis
MNILFHHRTLGDGAEGIHIQAIVDSFMALGHSVKVVSLVGEKTKFRATQESRETKWDQIKSFMPGPIYELGEITYNVKGLKMIKDTMRDFRPDIIYDRYAHFSFSAMWAARKFGLPVILEVNSPYSLQKRRWEKLYFPSLSKLGEQKIFNAASHIIAVSTPMKKIVMSYGVPDSRITVLPNGTDPHRFLSRPGSKELKKNLGLEGKIVLGFVGILRSWHNIDKLLSTLEEINLRKLNAVMVFLGDGPSFDELTADTRRRFTEDTVKFLGRIPHADIPKYIDLFDIAISPHATSYSSPMKILEYMAMEKAILAPEMENVQELVEDGHTGILFKPNDSISLKEKLLMLIAEPTLRKNLGANARRKVLTGYTWSDNARKTLGLAEQLLMS